MRTAFPEKGDLGSRRLLLHLATVPLGLLCGALVTVQPMFALVLGMAVAGTILLERLGPSAFAAAIVLIAVTPWYPLDAVGAGPPVVSEVVFCSAIAAAAIVPWLWSVSNAKRIRTPSRLALVYGLLYPALAVSIYASLDTPKDMIASPVFGLLFGGAAFLCARRFGQATTWPAAAFAGLLTLVVAGLVTFAGAPGERVGGFTGYPITYGALVVVLLPGALVFAARKSRLLAVASAAVACGLLVLSQSRSSWIAVIVMLLFAIALLVRLRRWPELRRLSAVAAIAIGLIFATGSLNGIVERKLSADVRQTDSVTHRLYSYGYAFGEIRERPLFGAGAPGYSAEQSEKETDIGALDNGYLSITVDMGFFGLLAVLPPIIIALVLIGRWLVGRIEPPADEAALAFAIVGLSVVTIFYDSFYWAQLSLLLFAMGGTLSRRLGGRARPPRGRAQPPVRVAQRLRVSPGSS